MSDVYQDLYGEGSFTGKGIYDVDAFQLATHGRFPENTLLSHDLIEGNYARAGLVTDVIVYDDYPVDATSTYTRRKHRWIRGDWQLLPWLRRRVPGPDGLEPNRLSLLSRWKIIDNLRRSTVELSQLLLLIAGWTMLPGSAIRWTLLGLARHRGAVGDRCCCATGPPPARQVVARVLRAPWRRMRGVSAQQAVAGRRVPAAPGLDLGRRDRANLLSPAACRVGMLLEWQSALAGRTARVEPAHRDVGVPCEPAWHV